MTSDLEMIEELADELGIGLPNRAGRMRIWPSKAFRAHWLYKNDPEYRERRREYDRAYYARRKAMKDTAR